MLRSRPTRDVRVDALRMALDKLNGGCPSCADSYLDLARKHGATDAEIESILKASSDTNGSSVSRRAFVRGAAVVTATAAAQLLVPPQFLPAAAAASSADLTGVVAWIYGVSASTGEPGVVGITASGQSLGVIGQPGAEAFIRSRRGQLLIAVSQEKAGAVTRAMVTLYDARTGRRTGSIQGRPIQLGVPNDWDAVKAVLSPGEGFVAVLHQSVESLGTPTPVSKVLPGEGQWTIDTYERQVTNSIEIFDLTAQAATAFVSLDTSLVNMPGGELQIAPNNRDLYAFVFSKAFKETLIRLQYDGVSIREVERATDGEHGHKIPALVFPPRFRASISATGDRIVRFHPEDAIQLIDLHQLSLQREIRLGRDLPAARPLLSSAHFLTADRLCVANPMSGVVQLVDASQGSVVAKVSLPAIAGLTQEVTFRYPGRPAIAATADGSKLYVLDVRTTPGAVWTMQLPTLSIVDRWAPPRALSAIWLSEPDEVLFALTTDQVVYALQANVAPTPVALTGLAAAAGFLTSTTG